MKSTNCLALIVTVLCAALLTALPLHGEEKKSFDADEIMTEIEKQMELSREKWEQLKPVLEEKSKQMRQDLDEHIDEGFAKMEELSSKLDSMSADVHARLTDILTSEEAARLKEYLGKMDKEALDHAKEKMIADLSAVLELTEEQAGKIKPVLEETYTELIAMLTEITAEGKQNWAEFKAEFEKLTGDLLDKVEETLNEEQVERLKKFNEEQEEKIESVLSV